MRCCGLERLFRLPVLDCGQQLKLTAMSFDDIDGGELKSIVTAPEELLTWRKQELEACNTDRSVSPTYRMSWDSHVLLSAVLGLFSHLFMIEVTADTHMYRGRHLVPCCPLHERSAGVVDFSTVYSRST